MADLLVRTERLVLEPMSCPLMEAVMAADWAAAERELAAPFPPEWRQMGWQWLDARLAEGRQDERLLAWGTQLARRRVDAGPMDAGPVAADPVAAGPVVAEIGFHGPPDGDGWAEIGYQVVAAHRRQGYAQEAVTALVAWAAQRGVTGVRACIDPQNDASIGLVRKLGFTHVGEQTHEILGQQLIFERAGERLTG